MERLDGKPRFFWPPQDGTGMTSLQVDLDPSKVPRAETCDGGGWSGDVHIQ